MQVSPLRGIYSPIRKKGDDEVKCAYLPEGSLLNRPENLTKCASADSLLRCVTTRDVLEGIAMASDAQHNLIVKVGPFTGVIPRQEAALGISEGSTREIAILARVGKPVAFVVTGMELTDQGEPRPILSRCQAQALALSHLLATLQPGQIIPAVVTHLEPFGAFVDVGCGVPSMIGIENISISRLPHPDQRFQVGQRVRAVVTGLDRDKGRILLSHKELLGTWEENAARFTPGMTVPGCIRSVKDYGLFVELTPNLSGLAEPKAGYVLGEWVSVYIKSIQPQFMKIKLLLIDHLSADAQSAPLEYFLTSGILEHWRYAPAGCKKPGYEVVFNPLP